MGHHSTTFTPASDVALIHGVIQGTQVLTLDGEIPVEFLEIGDRVLTRNGARVLKSIEITVVRHARMVRIGASTLGHERPEEDVLVPATQKILVRDWRAMALAGTKQALIAASRLTDGEFIRGEMLDLARIYTLAFEDDAVIYAGGLELACDAVVVTA
jgi:Hint domain